MSAVLGLGSQIRWQDVVEVVVLTVVLFRLYLWLRGTVVLQVLIGILMLAGTALVADALDLVLTAYLLQAAGAVATLVIIVVFRAEIRQALLRASPLRWWLQRRGRADPAGYAPALLSRALFALAEKRIGALVVVPGTDPVGEHVTGGTEINALLSEELLESVFQPGSPIHDGAAVLEGERLHRAGAFLPLSTRLDLPDRLGTRHRAATGLSEHCDALVLVVSEERGEVSAASSGTLRLLNTPAELEAELRKGSGTSAASEWRNLRRTSGRHVLENGVALLAILAVVVAAWHAIAGDRGAVTTLAAPVIVRDLPDGMATGPAEPSEIRVRLRGPRGLISRVGASDVEVGVSLAGQAPGQHVLDVDVVPPPGVSVEGLDPPEVRLEVIPEAAGR